MSTDLDTARIVRSWLRSDEHEVAERVLAAVVEALDTTPQRRPLWPVRRITEMSNYAKLAIAAAALVAIAVVGYSLLPAGNSPAVGGAVASPSTTPSASVSSSQSPESRRWPVGDLQAQRYHVTHEGVPFSFAPPSLRWRSPVAGELVAGTGTAMGEREDDYAWILPGVLLGDMVPVATDPCNGDSVEVNASTIDDLAAALATIPGTTAEQPVGTTVGGLRAKLVTLTVDPDPPCDIDSFWLFGQTSLHPNSVNSIIRFWITDLDGQQYGFLADQASADPLNEREIQQIIDSIQFE